MKKRLLLLAVLVGGVMAILRRLPPEQREGVAHLRAQMRERMQERMSEQMERMMGRMMERVVQMCQMIEQMPDDFPPKMVMTTLRRLQEQNDQMLALMREQNELLRERVLAEGPSSRRSSSSRAEAQQE